MKKNKKHKGQKQKRRTNPDNSTRKYVIDWEGLIIVSIMGALFAGASIFNGSSVSIGLMVGLFIGYAGLPYFDPKKWKPRPFVCSVLGGALGGVIAISWAAAWGTVALSVVAGLIVGFFALKWVPHITLP